MVPLGVTALLYQDAGLIGQPLTVNGRGWLDADEKMYCYNLPNEWEDRVKSMGIQQNNGLSKGRWRLVASGQQVAFTINIGFETSKSDAEAETEQTQMSREMSAGIEFEGVGETATVSNSYSHSLQTST